MLSWPRACILCYHSVHPAAGSRFLTPERFEAHLEWLRGHCDLVLPGALAAQPVGPRAGRPRVAVTFDDGHSDNYEYAFPLLQKHRAPAAFFLTAGYLDGLPAVIDRFRTFFGRDGRESAPMSWAQVREMAAAGLEMAAHTYTHPNLNFLSSRELDFEIRQSKMLLEDRLGRPVNGFAYPYGKPRSQFDRRAVELVQVAGYHYAVTTVNRGLRRTDSPWTLPRLSIGGDTVTTLAEKVSGAWDPLGYFHEWAPRWLIRLVAPRAFDESAY